MAKRLPTSVVIAAFHEEKAADAVAKTLKAAMKEGKLVYTNLAIITKDKHAKVKITEMGEIKPGYGAAAGAVIGGLSCCLLGPAGIAAGATAGAAVGAAGAAQIEGLDKHKLNQLGDVLQPQNSAIIAVFEEVMIPKSDFHDFDKERDEMVYQLAKDIGETLRNNQDVSYAVAVGDDGLMMTRKAKGPDAADIQGLLLTKEGTVVARGERTHSHIAYEVGAADADWTNVQYEGGVVTKDGAAILGIEATVDKEGGVDVTEVAAIAEK